LQLLVTFVTLGRGLTALPRPHTIAKLNSTQNNNKSYQLIHIKNIAAPVKLHSLAGESSLAPLPVA